MITKSPKTLIVKKEIHLIILEKNLAPNTSNTPMMNRVNPKSIIITPKKKFNDKDLHPQKDEGLSSRYHLNSQNEHLNLKS